MTNNMSFWSKLSGLLPSDISAGVRKCDLEKAKALLEGKPDLVFKTDRLGWTPLHDATHWHYKTPRKCCWPSRPTSMPRIISGSRLCTLHCAMGQGFKDVPELRPVNRADVNAQDEEGVSSPWRIRNSLSQKLVMTASQWIWLPDVGENPVTAPLFKGGGFRAGEPTAATVVSDHAIVVLTPRVL